MVGNWYCVPSSCGRVVYREYLPPVVRWRYPGEAWQEIEGDDYQLQDTTPKWNTERGKRYRMTAKVVCASRTPPARYTSQPVQFEAGEVITVYLFNTWHGAIYDWYPVKNGLNANSLLTYTNYTSCNTTSCICEKRTIESILYTTNKSGSNVRCKSEGESLSEPIINMSLGFLEVNVIEQEIEPRFCRTIPQTNCIFSVTNNGQIVYQETRSVCPEVEKLPCRLSDETRQIEIKKIPYLERIEVVDYAYDVRWGLLNDSNNYGLLLFKGKIPDNCLNIYENSITSIIPNDFISITNTPENGFNLIAQICSAPGCPPPEYQVICDCNCESCPEDTCPVKCGDHICCYGDDGIAVKSIPIDSYCGD